MNTKTFNHLVSNWDEYDLRKNEPAVFDASMQWERDFLAGRIAAYHPFLIKTRIHQAIELSKATGAAVLRRQFTLLVLGRLGL